MRLLKLLFLVPYAITATSYSTTANEFGPVLEYYLENEIMHWSQSSIITSAIKAQNHDNINLVQTQIEKMDDLWRKSVENKKNAHINLVLNNINNNTASFLREQIEISGGIMREIFIMDNKGLNVAASHITSDYWQGDEDKFQKTYGTGANSVHIGEVEFDESTQRYLGQISITIADPLTGVPIGAMTIGVDAKSLL